MEANRPEPANRIVSFLRNHNFLAVECLVFAKFCGLATCAIAYSMLLQDKVCVQHYHQNVTDCVHLAENKESFAPIRDRILSETSKFSTYKSLIEFVPMFMWSLFVGSFLDRYVSGTRTLLILSTIGDLFTYLCVLLSIYHFYDWSPYVLLVACIQIFFTGGMISFLTTIFRYLALTVDETSRPIKFALFEASVILGFSAGSLMAGRILKLNQINADHPRSYEHNYLVGLILTLISFALIFCLKKTPARNKPAESAINNNDNEQNIEENSRDRTASISGSVNALLDEDGKQRAHTSRLQNIREEGQVLVKSFFSLSNVSETLACVTRPRANHARVTILVLFFLQLIQVLVFMGQSSVFFQFAERVYHWDVRTLSIYSACSKILATFFMTIWVVLFVKKFKVNQRKLIVLGLLSAFISQTLLGTFLAPITFILVIPIESFGGLIAIAVRSMTSSLVDRNEIGKIFSLLTTLETGLPLLGTLVYTSLFAISITNLPGLIYQFSGLLFLLGFLAYMAEEFYTKNCNKKDEPEEESEDSSTEQAVPIE